MKPDEFAREWVSTLDTERERERNRLVRWPVGLLPREVPADAREFLEVAGLPDSAAPFLSFKGTGMFGRRTAEPILGTDKKLFPSMSLPPSVAIGYTGSADPIVIEFGSGRVLTTAHDYSDRTYLMNSSVAQLAAFLLRYRQFVRACKAAGKSIFLHDDAPDPALVAATTADLRAIDPAALAHDAFWTAMFD